MDTPVKSAQASPRVPWWSFRRLYLLWLLVAVAVAGITLQRFRQWNTAQSLLAMSTSDLRIEEIARPGDPEVHLRLAERYLWEERNEDAMNEARRAVDLAPRSAQAYYLLGKAYQRFHQAAAGIKALERAVELDPYYAPARFLLGHGYYWSQHPLPAARQFQAYVEMEPADDIGFRFLGLAHMNIGNLSAAEKALLRAVELGPDSSGNHQALGGFYRTRSQDHTDEERAAQELLRALQLNPDDRITRLQAASALEHLNRLKEAADLYEVVFAKSPTDPRYCYSLLQIYTRLHDAPNVARYRTLYEKIVRARDATRAITAQPPGMPTYPTP